MNNIILIGFMGCGKTSLGKRLSEQLNYQFVDTDEWIEKKEKRSISDIFASDGEAAFRKMETECIEELIRQKDTGNIVLSVGGGLVLKEENRILLKKLGKVIYLSATQDTIYSRLKKDTKRPLLQGDNPREKINRLMHERESIYREACDAILQVDHKSIAQCMDEIVQDFKTMGKA